MQIIRTISWIVITAILVAFLAMNWEPAAVNIWPNGNDYVNVQSKMGFLIILFLFLGFVPTWLYHRGVKWRLNRRIETLEKALQASSAPAAPPPVTAPASVPPTAPADPLAPPSPLPQTTTDQ